MVTSSALNSIKTRNGTAGFTLVELLISMVVLITIIILCSQILSMVMNIWRSGRSQADNLSQARLALDQMSRDIQAAAIRSDLPAFFSGTSGSTALVFYTKQQSVRNIAPDGTSIGGTRPLSAILYSVVNVGGSNSLLRRSANGFNYNDAIGYSPTAWAIQMASATFDADIGPGVLIMKYQFIGRDGKNVLPAQINPGWAKSSTLPGVMDLRAVTISIAVIDGESLKLLQSTGKLQQLQDNFDTSDPGSICSFRSRWQAQIDSASHPLTQGGVPPAALRGLRTFEQTVMLPLGDK